MMLPCKCAGAFSGGFSESGLHADAGPLPPPTENRLVLILWNPHQGTRAEKSFPWSARRRIRVEEMSNRGLSRRWILSGNCRTAG